MTKVISMAIELDQDMMVTNMCVKSGEDWTNSFQELDRKQSSRRTYGQGQPYMTPLCGGIKRILEKNKEIAGSEKCSPNAYCL
mgnify:CR=1 FL=1